LLCKDSIIYRKTHPTCPFKSVIYGTVSVIMPGSVKQPDQRLKYM